MAELGWTSRQFEEENTSEDISRLTRWLSIRDKAERKYPKPPAPHAPTARHGVARKFH